MLSAKEQRILRQIERDLRREDRWLGWHLASVRLRELRRRRWARACVVIELVLLVLGVVGAVFALPVLFVVGVGFGVLVPLVALAFWVAPPVSPNEERPPDLPYFW